MGTGTAWSLIGLVLEVAGVIVLGLAEVKHLAAFLRYSAEGEDHERWRSEVNKRSWWARPMLNTAARLGGGVMDMGQDDVMDAASEKLLGYSLIVLGFMLQAAGVLASRW